MIRNIKQFLFIAGLLIIAAGAQPGWAAIWTWSTTASTNATADPSINWAEGMAPSAVNDSARAMMAVLAAWRNDISGANTSAGTTTAYTLATSEGVNTTPVNGQMISFIAHATSGASPTLTVDGGNTYPLWLNGAAAPTGTLVASTPYRVAFSTANSAWLLEAGYGNPYSIPLGGILWSTAPTAPNSSFVPPYGQCISTTTYAAYWVQQGSPASGSCPGGQFAIIDHRGRIPAALDTLPGSTAAGRLTNAAAGCGTAFNTMGGTCANGAESKTLTSAQLPASIPYTDTGHQHTLNPPAATSTTLGNVWYFGSSNVGSASVLTNSAVTGITINPSGGAAHSIMPPVIGLIPYLRIL